jgi:precorrin-6B methylase 1
MRAGSLIVVGTGIRTVGQLTMEAVAWIRQSDKVFHVVGDPVALAMIDALAGARAESLSGLYADGQPRMHTYLAMVERVLASVRAGAATCFAAYGHPGVFAFPTHESIRRARAEGFPARMLPGISAEDCLFADLGVDPGTIGCQSYEATDFLVNARIIDPSSNLVLWQIGVLGDANFRAGGYDRSALPLLVERLLRFYPAGHPVYLYEAAVLPGCEPVILPVPVAGLAAAPMTPGFTAYIPPARPTRTDAALAQRLPGLHTG